ncbi:WXG100 family type VII secretion target [Mycolicibacterium goodii]|uniref:WXG100 family type VII secretion target n=1 Tax=Mycolicibacterium goodii TaxID=134601 RepID=A0A0K0X2Y7_MYCGD|nr:hypothetical protein AFA91_07290 [Mycolicibacterium goodii]
MDQLRVNPALVHESGVQVGELAETLRSELSASSQQIAASQSGWIGRSAEALSALLAEWDNDTEIHHRNIAGHGERFVQAARMYGHVDENEADSLKNASHAFGTDV